MSRLSYLQDHEVAIQSIFEELDNLKRYLASGGYIDPQNVQELSKCLERLLTILGADQAQAPGLWQDDQVPLPSWLQPRQRKPGSTAENVGKSGSAVARRLSKN